MRMIDRKRRSLLLQQSCLLCCVILFSSCADHCGEGVDAEPSKAGETKLTRAQIIRIASQAVEDRFGVAAEDLTIFYDKGNKTWNAYFANDFPNLSGRDYQAVSLNRMGVLKLGGGPFWVCVDRTTGEVLVAASGV